MNDFSLLITAWYRQNARSLPWRATNDPYKIWLSEVILQQTRIDQGMNYYHRFIERYPTVHDLAEADERDVLNDWQGLGYYSRARNLHQTARTISSQFEGRFPNNYVDLLSLKGIGPYSAAAIASFAFGEKKAVVDGNVFRVISRVFDIDEPIDTTTGKKIIQQLADQLISERDPATHNQAIMELGALICSPKNPNCSACPLEGLCQSRISGTNLQRPVKSKKTKVRDRFFHYLIYEWDEMIIMKKRGSSDVWQHLYDFPLFETDGIEPPEFVLHANYSSIVYKHILSHQRIHATFHHFDHQPRHREDEWIVIHKEDLHKYPVPRLIENYLLKKWP